MIDIDDLHLEYIPDGNGKKKSAILHVGEFNELLEDIEDSAIIAERKNEPTISHEQFLEELKIDGIL